MSKWKSELCGIKPPPETTSDTNLQAETCICSFFQCGFLQLRSAIQKQKFCRQKIEQLPAVWNSNSIFVSQGSVANCKRLPPSSSALKHQDGTWETRVLSSVQFQTYWVNLHKSAVRAEAMGLQFLPPSNGVRQNPGPRHSMYQDLSTGGSRVQKASFFRRTVPGYSMTIPFHMDFSRQFCEK